MKTKLAFFGLFFIILSLVVAAAPESPDKITVTSNGRNSKNSGSTISQQAQAGNVTGLIVNYTRITEAWQGYFGNVTGAIVLDDANNFTLYDWQMASPLGEIYASNGSSVTWSKVYCMNTSSNRNVNGSSTNPNNVFYNINASQIELNFGISQTDTDGLSETFNDTFTSSFSTGSVGIDTTDGCSSAHPYTDEFYSNAWDELLLSDNNSIIFTALLEQNQNGFQPGSETFDFQLMVLENGHLSDTAATPYYFFVELS